MIKFDSLNGFLPIHMSPPQAHTPFALPFIFSFIFLLSFAVR